MKPIYELNITWEVTWTPDDPDVIAATKKGNLAEDYDENEGID